VQQYTQITQVRVVTNTKNATVKSVRVAIADDSAVVRERLMQKLARIEGIQMAWQAQNASEAIMAFQRLKPEVAILDIHMRDESGIDVLAHFKREWPQITVIMLTNCTLPPFKKRCLEAGADYFFDKSTEFEKVIEVLRSIVTICFMQQNDEIATGRSDLPPRENVNT
jgi:DNA-binding NarL/FixJ family response regulator